MVGGTGIDKSAAGSVPASSGTSPRSVPTVGPVVITDDLNNLVCLIATPALTSLATSVPLASDYFESGAAVPSLRPLAILTVPTLSCYVSIDALRREAVGSPVSSVASIPHTCCHVSCTPCVGTPTHGKELLRCETRCRTCELDLVCRAVGGLVCWPWFWVLLGDVRLLVPSVVL